MALEKLFLKFFSHDKSTRAKDHWGLGQFGPQGHDWQDVEDQEDHET